MYRQPLQPHRTLQESIIPKLKKRVFTNNNVKVLIPLSENTSIKLALKKYVSVARKMD